MRAKLLQSCLTLCQRPLSMGFSRQEYWSGVPCPSPGDLPDPGIESASLTSPVLAGWFFFFYHWSNLGSSSQGSQICAIRGGAEFDENMIRLCVPGKVLFSLGGAALESQVSTRP